MFTRRQFLNHVGGRAAVIASAGSASAVWAASDPAIGSNHVAIGMSVPLTGPLGIAGKEHVNTLTAALAQINRFGGIHGRELRMVVMEDEFKVPRTVANATKMIEDSSVVAMLSQFGTGNVAAIQPLTEKAGVVMLGPLTGADQLRKPEHRYVFHTRASYADEVNRLVKELNQMGLQDIAVVYLDNAFGNEVLGTITRALSSNQLKAVTALPIALDGKNAEEVAQQIMDARAGAVMLATTGSAGTDFVLAVRKRAAALPVVGLSVTFTDTVKLGSHLFGLAQASVVPNGMASKFSVVREFRAALDDAKLSNPNGRGVDTWVNAQVLAEGLRRAGRELTREKLRASLAAIRGLDIGEVRISFANPAPYIGQRSVKLGIYGADGVLRS